MKTSINKPENVSHTIQSKTKAANQASLSNVLQTYKEEEEPMQQKTENQTGLPDNLKEGIESLSGYNMDDVKVHYNSSKPTQLQALAYTQGTDIHVAPGQEKHLPHEAWHVVQQKQGRVKPTVQMQGMQVNDEEGLEREADVKGIQLKQNKNLFSNLPANRNNVSLKNIIQKVNIQKNPDAKEDAKIFFRKRHEQGNATNGMHNYAFLNNDNGTCVRSDSSSHAEIKLLALSDHTENVDIVSELEPCSACEEFMETFEETHAVDVTTWYNLDYTDDNAKSILNMYRDYQWISCDPRRVTYILKKGERILGI